LGDGFRAHKVQTAERELEDRERLARIGRPGVFTSRGGVMNIDDFLKERGEAGQEVVVTEIGLSPPRHYEVWGETVLVKPVAHAVSFVDEQGRAVTALIVGDQAGRAIMEGKNLCPRWTDHDVSDPGVTL
jgi:hypothetical protein